MFSYFDIQSVSKNMYFLEGGFASQSFIVLFQTLIQTIWFEEKESDTEDKFL